MGFLLDQMGRRWFCLLRCWTQERESVWRRENHGFRWEHIELNMQDVLLEVSPGPGRKIQGWWIICGNHECVRSPMDGWMGGWDWMDGCMDGWTDERNLDFILFRLNHVKLLFLFKNYQILNFTQAVVFEGKGTDACNLIWNASKMGLMGKDRCVLKRAG